MSLAEVGGCLARALGDELVSSSFTPDDHELNGITPAADEMEQQITPILKNLVHLYPHPQINTVSVPLRRAHGAHLHPGRSSRLALIMTAADVAPPAYSTFPELASRVSG